MQPQAKDCQLTPEADDIRMDSPPELPAGRRPWWHPDLAPDFMLISDLWPLELWQNKGLFKKKKYMDHFKIFIASILCFGFLALSHVGS